MVRPVNGRHLWLVACAALVAMAMTLPAAAQSTGMVRGVVKDAAGKTLYVWPDSLIAPISTVFTSGLPSR